MTDPESSDLDLPVPRRPSQAEHPGRATARTGAAMLPPVAMLYPLLVDHVGRTGALWIMCALVVGNAVVTRLMATDAAERLLARVLPWLTALPPDTDRNRP